MTGIAMDRVGKSLHLDMVGNAARVIEQHADRQIIRIGQAFEPGLCPQPVPNLVVEFDFVLVDQLQKRSGNERLAYAAGEHTIRGLHRLAALEIRITHGTPANPAIRHYKSDRGSGETIMPSDCLKLRSHPSLN